MLAQRLPTRVEIQAELYSRSFKRFVRAAWRIIDPSTPLVWGWHLDAVCDHYEALYQGEVRDLIVNIPPRFSKSLLAGVFLPAWVWTQEPSARFLFSSYAQTLSTRDSVKCRRLIESPWYRERWGDRFKLTSDQNQKTRFENDQTGYRIATSVGGAATGEGGDFIVVDDPHSALQALSETERETAITWWDETMSTRANDPRTVRRLVVMQRLHENDLSGHLLGKGRWEHLMLPMRFEADRRCSTSIGFSDPRTEEGQLLDPERFPEAETEKLETALGEYGAAGQLQQRPAPRKGGQFKPDLIEIVDALPETPLNVVRYWDKAGTAGGSGAETAGVKLGWLPKLKKYVILDCVHGRWSAEQRERTIRQTAEIDGREVRIGLEQEPGSGGKESAESSVRNLAGFLVFTERPTGEKPVRAEPFSIQVEAGNVAMLRGDWNAPMLSQMRMFPAGVIDMVDAGAGAFNECARRSVRPALAVY